MLFKCWTHRSTATESPICTMAVPSLVLRNFIYIEIKKKRSNNFHKEHKRNLAYPCHISVQAYQVEELIRVRGVTV